MAKWTYERQVNVNGEDTLATKLMHMVKRCINTLLTHDEAMLAAKLNVHSGVAYECSANAHGEAALKRV